MNYNNTNNNDDEYEQEDNEEVDDDEGNDGKGNNDESGVVIEKSAQMNLLSNNYFFNEIRSRLAFSPNGLTQRKRVRFFHICLCTEEETDIQPLLACDITHTLSGEPPSA